MSFHGAMTPHYTNKDKDDEGSPLKAGIVVSTLVWGIVAMAINPALKGITGVVGALCTGLIATLSSCVAGIVTMFVGAVSVGTALGLYKAAKIRFSKTKEERLKNKSLDMKSSIVEKLAYTAIGVAYLSGGVAGYKISKDFVVKNFDDKKIYEFFNKSSSKIEKETDKKFEIDRENFKAIIKTPAIGL